MILDKAKMAHEMALELARKPDFEMFHIKLAIELGWKYADAMQVEADKRVERGVPEVIRERCDFTPAINKGFERASNGVGGRMVVRRDKDGKCLHAHYYSDITQVGKREFCMHCGDSMDGWQPDWSQAPDGVVAWVYCQLNKSGYWCVRNPEKLSRGWDTSTLRVSAPSFDYKGDWRDSLRKRPEGK